MTPELHPEMDDLILFCLGAPAGAPESEDAAVIARVQRHLLECQSCAAQVEQLRTEFALVAMSVPEVAPPAAAKGRLLQAAGVSPATAPGQQAEVKTFPATVRDGSNLAGGSVPSAKKRTNPALVWGGWVAALACLFYVMHVRNLNRNMDHRLAIETAQLNQTRAAAERAREIVEVLTSPQSQRVTLVSAHARPEPSGDAVYLKSSGALVFTANHLVPLPPNKTYELWVIPANGSAPLPAGTFQPDAQGMASVLLPHLPKGIAAKAFGVTMENAGGSTTPTMPILLAGG